MKKKKSVKKAEFQFKNPYFINIFTSSNYLFAGDVNDNILDLDDEIEYHEKQYGEKYLYTLRFDDKEANIIRRSKPVPKKKPVAKKSDPKKAPAKVNIKAKIIAIAKPKATKKVVKKVKPKSKK